MRFLHRYLLTFLLLGLCLLSTSALAQEETRIERLEVVLWPEYDRPAVLVFLRVQLAGGASLPMHVELRILAAVGEPHAVATRGIDGSLVYAEYTRQVAEGGVDLAMFAYDVQQPVGGDRHGSHAAWGSIDR